MKTHKKDFAEMSNRSCRCGRKIKQNVIDRKPTADRCFECYREDEAKHGNNISTAREIRTGKRFTEVRIHKTVMQPV